MATRAARERILIVDDAADTREVVQRNLSAEGFETFAASGPQEALAFLDHSQVDLVITDLKMHGASGLDIVRHVRENLPGTEVMMITGYATIEGAVEAVKTGAEEYLAKPFTSDELIAAVRRSIGKLHLRKAASMPAEQSRASMYGLLGASDAMQEVYKAIGKTAPTNATVLITGESGTGKELVARAMHYSSPRASGPFVPVNCGGIPEGLLESELFGHEKGAFTGAIESRAGFFQTAGGGSIFLDEIGEVSLAMQVKLLRVLQDREVCMVGATKPRRVDLRVIAATNKDLVSLVKKGTFREDLYFRLNVITIAIPPLRERGDDVLLLAAYFSRKFSEELGKPALKFSDAALAALKHYDWPGNVRELENVIQRTALWSEGKEVDASDFPSLMRFSAGKGQGAHKTLSEMEAAHISNMLSSVGGNKTKAAEILGIDRKTLREKMKRYCLE